MNRYEKLFATQDLSLSRFDHPPHQAHDDPDEEVSTRWAIAFVQAGSFDVVHGGRSVRLGRGGVFLSRPGFVFRCRHQDTCPSDVCLSAAFADSVAEEFAEAWLRTSWAVRPSPTPRLAFAGRRLREAADSGDAFQVERWMLAALAALEHDAQQARPRGR